MKEPNWLVRVVEYFSNETDELVGEFVLSQVELSELQRLWNAPPDGPMVESSPSKKSKLRSFESWLASILTSLAPVIFLRPILLIGKR